MANIKWCETPTDDDCLPNSEWGAMVEYIKHSACTDFTIYGTEGTCVDTDQIFRFTSTAAFAKMYGKAGAGENLMISANDTDTYPRITLFGASDIWLDSADDVFFKESGVDRFKFYDGKSIDFLGDRGIHIDDDETYYGHGAGDAITNGEGNTCVGLNTGTLITTGDNNVLVGALAGATSGVDIDNCVLIGVAAGQNNTQDNIVALGYNALINNTGVQNTALGYSAGAATTGGNNTIVGFEAMLLNIGGGFNTAIGSSAMTANLTGNFNTAIGETALGTNEDGDNNVAIGYLAGGATGVDINKCVFIGQEAGENNTANNVIGMGFQALHNNTGGSNTAVGYLAMDAANTGANNDAFGEGSLGANTSGWGNIAMGNNSLAVNTTGYRNTALGMFAGGAADVNDCVYLGYYAGQNNAASQRLYINPNSSAFPLIYGEFDTDIVKFGNNADAFFFKFSVDANDAVVETESENRSIYLKPHGTGLVKFGLYEAKGAEAFAGFTTIEDQGGTPRKVMICA